MKSSGNLLFTYLLLPVFILGFINHSNADDLNAKRMEKTTTDILEIFKGKSVDKGKDLKKYISGEWIDDNNLDIGKYTINYYSPDYYEILCTTSDICIASIGGETWEHLLIFKFTNENGNYKVVPKGVSKSSADFLDPWFSVKEYYCNKDKKEDK